MTEQIKQHMGPIEIGLLLFISLCWGGSFFFIEILLDYLPPLTIVTLRIGLAVIVLWGIVFLSNLQRPQGVSQWAALTVLGLLSIALPFSLITWAQTRIDSGIASVLNATAPLFVVLLAGITLSDERFTRGKIAGVFIGVLGVAVLIGPEALTGIGGSALGQIAVIGASFSYALAAVFSRRFAQMGLSPTVVATGQVSMATLMLVPITLTVEGMQSYIFIPVAAWASLLSMALLSTVLANVLYFRLIKTAGATNSAIVGFLMPVVGTSLGIALLGEAFSAVQIIGAGLIGVGLIVMDGRWVRLVRSSKN